MQMSQVDTKSQPYKMAGFMIRTFLENYFQNNKKLFFRMPNKLVLRGIM